MLRLEQAKQTPNQRFVTELSEIGESEKQATQKFDIAARLERAGLEAKRDELLSEQGKFETLVANPRINPEFSDTLENAANQLENLQTAINGAKDKAREMERLPSPDAYQL